MRTIGRRILTACLLALLSLPAQATVIVIPYTITVPAAEKGDYSNIHRVGVISLVGGKLRLYKVNGFLSNSEKSRDIAAWGMDDVVRATLKQYLTKRFEIVDIPVPDSAVVADEVDPGLFRTNLTSLRKYLKSLNRTDIDAFIVVRPDYYADFPGGAAGLSIEDTPADGPVVWANYDLSIVDARTFTTIGHAFSRLQPKPGTPYFPGMRAPTGVTLSEKAELGDAPLETLKPRLMLLLRFSLLETLRSLDTGATLPAPGSRELLPIPPSMQPFPAWKTLAIVSAVGETIELDHRGTLLRHSETTVPFTQTHLDQEIETALAAKLDKRFTVKTVTVDRAKLAQLVPAIAEATTTVPLDGLDPAAGVDGYLVLLRRTGGVSVDVGTGDVQATGVGVLNITPLFDERTMLFANYTLAIVDGHTLKPMLLVAGRAAADSPKATPNVTIDNAAWPDNGKPTPEQMAAFHDTALQLMNASLDETLLRTGLTGMMIAVPPELAPAPQAPTSDSKAPAEPVPPSSP